MLSTKERGSSYEQIVALNENDYDEISALSQFAFQYELTEAEFQKKKEEAERHMIFGIKDQNKIAAKLHLIPLSVDMNGISMDMGGIGSVATWPEYRRNGMVKDLLSHALHKMKENGQLVSYLHPFSVPFYRKYGWEIAFAKKKYQIPMERIKKNWNGSGYVKRTEAEIATFNTIYHTYMKKFNGSLIRDEKWWKQRVWKNKPLTVVAYNNEHKPEGYLFYSVKNRVFKVEELIFCSLNGLKVLLQFIANHDSMADQIQMEMPENDNLPVLIDEPRFEQKVSPYFMARIVDVNSYLKQYVSQTRLQDISLQINVQDDFLPDNTGTYCLEEVDGKIDVIHEKGISESNKGISCNIQQLTTMFFGYKRPTELYELGLIGGNERDIHILERLIPRKQTYFPDFF
ncbi:GNAT family N-acetyltransferase [Bacilli bacterium]|nr:GNAT family N-acetyltransferase [Bacilli bacterium]PZD87543.1 GNAT family N-acetyltransferase [Bacilli bacterium]PZD90871.1 GNAT family N-acetyltransferase [Bacilli bacterium]RCO04414.1 GNAT family N-acetyltransferase [Bacilli bacterium]RCO10591.1 GNAT family N-acetyltransferase [Bacilli bacterium]